MQRYPQTAAWHPRTPKRLQSILVEKSIGMRGRKRCLRCKSAETGDFVWRGKLRHLRSSLDTKHHNSDPEVRFLTCGHLSILGFVLAWESGQLPQEITIRSFLTSRIRYRTVSTPKKKKKRALECIMNILTWRGRRSIPDEEDGRSRCGLDYAKNQDLHG